MELGKYALNFVGIRQGTKQHHNIIDAYNNGIKPLPRGYRVRYNDEWCATFVSMVMLKCGVKNAPYECSVYYMWKKAQQQKQTTKTPHVNDLIIYDWGNNGTLDHVGIIYKIVGNTLYVVEGNRSRQVGTRVISKTSNEIEGYIHVKSSDTCNGGNSHNINSVVDRVISGAYGNGNDRKHKLESEGYNYNEVQKLVNAKLKGGK